MVPIRAFDRPLRGAPCRQAQGRLGPSALSNVLPAPSQVASGPCLLNLQDSTTGFFPDQEYSPCLSCSQSHCYGLTAPYQKRPLCPHGRLHSPESGAARKPLPSIPLARAPLSPTIRCTPTNWPDLDSSGLKAPEPTERMTLTSSLKGADIASRP